MSSHRAAITRLLLPAAAVLSATIAIGCVAAPGASGVPTSSAAPSAASAPPSVAPSPLPSSATTSPSASPSVSPAGSPSGSSGSSSGACGVATWEKGSDDLVLRIVLAGGLVMPGVDMTNLPVISVYGDGTVIRPGPQIMIYPGPLLAGQQVAKLNEAGMRALLDAAEKAGLLVPDVTYESHGIADAPTTFFTLTADGCTHKIAANALMEDDNSTGLDKATIEARKKLWAFEQSLGDLRTLVGAANFTDGGLYSPTAYRLIVRDEPAGTGATGSQQPVLAWPLKTPLATFGEPIAAGMADTRCGTVEGADAATLTPLLEKANTETHWSSGGKTYYLMVRSLLPDESGCTDPTA